MLRDLATSLIISERIETTEARAKEVRSVVEKLITLGKKGENKDLKRELNKLMMGCALFY
nr:bL17 family ribosomal protein [Staphylococcus aureus]